VEGEAGVSGASHDGVSGVGGGYEDDLSLSYCFV
jgi:hypothetical protein